MFFARRLRGVVPIQIVLWRDMLAIGTAMNLLATFAALITVNQGGPTWLAAISHFSPLPHNIFVFSALGRASRRSFAAVGSWP